MKITFTLCLLLLFGFCNAQNLSIKSQVQDSKNQALPYATVLLTQERDSSLVKTAITSESGLLELNALKAGTYLLRISSIGYQTYSREIRLIDKSINLDPILLQESTENLDAVTVVAQKPLIEVLADKTVFNVENSIATTGSNSWELLRKAPGLIIDNNGAVILEGKTGVQFYFDGKPSRLSGDDLKMYLESLQSNSISRVEIITQPSSKYEAAGSAGIINIIFKKDKNLGANTTFSGSFTYGERARYSSSALFNYRRKMGNLFANYSNGFGNYTSFLYLFRRQNNRLFDARTESEYHYNTNNLRVGYDWFLKKEHTLGVLFNGNTANNFTENYSRTPIRPVGSSTNDSVLIAQNRNHNTATNYNANLNYTYEDSLGTRLSIDADYGRYESDRDAFQPNFYYNPSETTILNQNTTRQITPRTISIASLKGDYEQNMWKGVFSAGFKFSNVKTNNVFNFFDLQNEQFILNETQSNTFKYSENISAGYINFNRRWEKWNIQLGLRIEHTDSDGRLNSIENTPTNRVKRDYANWFPSGGLTYQLNSQNQFALNYSKRIQRPDYASLNPFEYKIDELSSSRGNPFLQPQYTHSLKLSHTYNYTLTTAVSYSKVTDFFAQVTQATGENSNVLSPQNIANQEIFNLSISYPKQIKDWWSVYLSLNAYTSRYRATNADFVSIDQETLSLYAQNTFNLPADLKMEISGWYSSPSVWSGTYNTRSLGSLNIAFQKKFLNDALQARLAFNDILYTSPWSGTTRYGAVFIEGSGGSDSRTLSFGLNYQLGNQNLKKARNRNTGLEEEAQRVSN